MRKFEPMCAVLITVAVIGLSHFLFLYYERDGDPYSRRVEVKVPPGTTFKEVQSELVEKGLLTRPGIFRWAAYLTRRETRIQSGRYVFRRGESVADLLGKLVGGEIEFNRVVVPEGFMLREIAGLLGSGTDVDSTAFHDLAIDPVFVKSLGVDAPSLEGYLFPDTYLFRWPVTAEDVARRMVNRFNEVFADSLRFKASAVGLTPAEAVTLASIIQAEAVFDAEMPRIAAVYHNRLLKGWRLEADPTVAYALGGVRRRLWHKDLQVRSPYNTYRVRGLPPGPICNPGTAALAAAVGPLAGSNDLYFVADGTGRHVFSRTLDDHNEARRRIRYGQEQLTPIPGRENIGDGEKQTGQNEVSQ